jgi:hypothetical protein
MLSRHPQTYSRLKERSTEESPRRKASSPQILLQGTKIHMTTLWHFLRAPPWPLADSYRMKHGLLLEFPINSSSEIVGTRLTRVVRRSPPLLFFLKEREGRTIKDGQDSDRPRVHEARGLDRRRLNLEQKRTKHATIQEHSPIKRTKDLRGV